MQPSSFILLFNMVCFFYFSSKPHHFMASSAGIGPATHSLEGYCSIHWTTRMKPWRLPLIWSHFEQCNGRCSWKWWRCRVLPPDNCYNMVHFLNFSSFYYTFLYSSPNLIIETLELYKIFSISFTSLLCFWNHVSETRIKVQLFSKHHFSNALSLFLLSSNWPCISLKCQIPSYSKQIFNLLLYKSRTIL